MFNADLNYEFMNNLKFVFFDLDDTLCDYRGAKQRATQRIDKILNENEIENKAFWKAYRITEPKLMRKFLDGALSREEYREQRFTEVLKIFNKNDAKFSAKLNKLFIYESNKVDIFKDVIPFLECLTDRGLDIALLTNGPSDGQRTKIASTCLGLFLNIYISAKKLEQQNLTKSTLILC